MNTHTFVRLARRQTAIMAVFALTMMFPAWLSADSSALILTGVAGDAEHGERFAKWTETTRKVLVDKFGFAPDRVVVLADKNTRKEEIRKAFATLKNQLKADDTFFLFFIGHGSFDAEYKFNISGPDFTGTEYNDLIGSVPAARTVIVNGTSSSGGSIDKLAAKNRIIVTATRSGTEANETIFYEHFLKGLEDATADEDKDQRVSVWEAFRFASQAVERFYKEQGRLATEHPVLSENGAEKPVAANVEAPPLARATAFQVDRVASVTDPVLRGLLTEKKALESKIDALRGAKGGMPEPEYERQMEALLVDLALKNQKIREQEKKK